MKSISSSILILAVFGFLAGCAPSLKWAAHLGRTNAVKKHLNKGADVSEKNEALVWAARMGRMEIAKLLINDGADVNCDEGSPLHMAVGYDRADLATLLIENGAKVVGSGIVRNAALGHKADLVKLVVGKSTDADIDDAIAELRSYNDRESTAGIALIERFKRKPSQGLSKKDLPDGRLLQPVEPQHPAKDPLDQDVEQAGQTRD